jgi:hypothetical protein
MSRRRCDERRGRGGTLALAAVALLAAAAPATVLAAAAPKPGPAASFGVPAAALPSNTCAARTLISPGPQRDGLFGYASAIQNQAVVISAPGERGTGAAGQRRAYLGLRAAPRPPGGCAFSSYFALAPVPSPPEDSFVQLSVFGATGAVAAGQRTIFLGSQVDSAYWCDYYKACGSSGGGGSGGSARAASAAASASAASPDPLLAQALAKASAPPSAALASRAGAAGAAGAAAAARPRLIGRASPQLSGRPVSVLTALAAAREAEGATVGERLRSFMAGSGAADRERRGLATAPLLRAASGAAAAASGGARAWDAAAAAAAAAALAERGASSLIAPLVANASRSPPPSAAASAAASSPSSSSSPPGGVRDGDGNGLRSAPPLLSLTGAAATSVPALSAERPRVAGAAGPLAAAAAAAAASAASSATDAARSSSGSSSSSSSNSSTAAASAAAPVVGLTPAVYGEVAVFYRLLAQGSPAQGPIANVRRTQVQGPFSLPVSFDLVTDADVNAFFRALFPGADPSASFFFLGSANPWVSASADGGAAAFNDLRAYGAAGYDSLLYDGSLQVFLRQGTTNAYRPVDLIYSPYPSDQVPMVFPLFSDLSADGLTLVATGWAYDEGPHGTDVVFVWGRASTAARFELRQELYYDSLAEAVTSVGVSPDGLALAVATTTFAPLDGSGALDQQAVLDSVAVARTYGRASPAAQFAPRCRFGDLLPDPSQWDVELAPTDNAGRVQAVKLAPIFGKKPRTGPAPVAGYRLLASVLGAPAEVYDYSRLGPACPSVPVQRLGAPLGVPGALDAFGDLAGVGLAADGRTAGVGSQLATEASFPQQSGAAYYYGLVPLATRF